MSGVGERPDEADDVSLEIALRRRLAEEPADAAVRKHAAELGLPRFPRVERRRDLTQDRLAVVGVDALFPSGLHGRFGGETGQVGDAFADVETAALEVGPKDTYRHHAREGREFRMAIPRPAGSLRRVGLHSGSTVQARLMSFV